MDEKCQINKFETETTAKKRQLKCGHFCFMCDEHAEQKKKGYCSDDGWQKFEVSACEMEECRVKDSTCWLRTLEGEYHRVICYDHAQGCVPIAKGSAVKRKVKIQDRK